jgi:ferrous iron transport protein A
MDTLIPLAYLPMGKKAKVKNLTADSASRRRLLDFGLISDTEVEALQKSPSGNLTAYYIRGTVIALRAEESSKIFVETL